MFEILNQVLDGDFHYGSYKRAQWFFVSPNHLGAFCAIVALACFGAMMRESNASAKRRRAWQIVVASVAVLATLLLLKTYSRGALAALVLGLMTGAFLWGRVKSGVLSLAVIVVLAAAMPGSMGRTAHAIRGDASVTNRVALWESALQVVAAGDWGNQRFDEIQWSWFQSPQRDLHYRSALSNSLNVLIVGGYGGLFAYLLGCGVTLALTLSLGRERRWARVVGLSLLGFHLCGLFSNMHDSWQLNLLFLALSMGAVAGIVAVYARGDRDECRRLAVGSVKGCLAASAAGTLLVLAGGRLLLLGNDEAWRARAFGSSGRELSVIESKTSSEQRLYWVCEQQVVQEYARGVIRPIALAGFPVTVVTYDRETEDPVGAITDFFDDRGADAGAPILLAGPIDGVVVASQALLASGTTAKVWIYEPEEANSWPTALGTFEDVKHSFGDRLEVVEGWSRDEPAANSTATYTDRSIELYERVLSMLRAADRNAGSNRSKA